LDHLYFDIVSNFVLRISYFASLGTSTSVENPLQISPFLKNKPNLPDDLMNVTSLITADYENIANSKLGENKPNTKPISRTPK